MKTLCRLQGTIQTHNKKNEYLVSLINELLEELVGGTFFSKIALKTGYHQIRMKSEDISKIVFGI